VKSAAIAAIWQNAQRLLRGMRHDAWWQSRIKKRRHRGDNQRIARASLRQRRHGAASACAQHENIESSINGGGVSVSNGEKATSDGRK
jgi:hypothetical protein